MVARTVSIIGRCYDWMLVDLGDRRLGLIDVRNVPVGARSCEIPREPEHTLEVDFDPGALEIFECDSSWCSNYGPRDFGELDPSGEARDFAQQHVLGPPPSWRKGASGYYCMGCCLPPR